MNTTTNNNALNFPPQIGFRNNPIHPHWPQPQPQPQMFDYYYSATNFHVPDFQPFKDSRIPRMPISSTFRPYQAWPLNPNSEPCFFSHYEAGDARELQNFNRNNVVVVDELLREKCWLLVNGKECPNGDRCNFFHPRKKKDKKDDGDSQFHVPGFSSENGGSAAVKLVNTRTKGLKKPRPPRLKGGMRSETLKIDDDSPMEQRAEPFKIKHYEKWVNDGCWCCPYGEKCKYAHKKTRPERGSAAVTLVNTMIIGFKKQSPRRLEGMRSKTEKIDDDDSSVEQKAEPFKIRHYDKKVYDGCWCCPYGEKCKYAHEKTEFH
ncbi:hypothetical protein ACH5RR_008167 [Cinchona calisaya]|uniref:C3H1-type domain-containing protein n=1 Tax=Cinchona calisaya TaxID=153742 RepID=A0ABD3AAK2_9GENT